MKRVKIFLVSFLFYAPLGFGVESDVAWYTRTEFVAADTSYRGISINDINPAWEKFSVLSYDILPKEAKEDVEWMKKEGFGFKKRGDFNNDGQVDEAVVGVYLNKEGEKGIFLMIITKRQKGNWRKLFLNESPGEASFSVLYGPKGKLYWSECLDCGGGPELKWDGKKVHLRRDSHLMVLVNKKMNRGVKQFSQHLESCRICPVI